MPVKPPTPVTLPDFARWKAEGRKISVLTAYDFTMASLLDTSGVDALLVGDSLGIVVQGKATTLGVTLDQMVYHVGDGRQGGDSSVGDRGPAVRDLSRVGRAGDRVGQPVPERDAVPGGEARRGPADGSRRSGPSSRPTSRSWPTSG